MKTSHWHLACKELPPQPRELNGRKTVLTEPMRGSEVRRQTGEIARQKMRVDGVKLMPGSEQVHCSGGRPMNEVS